MSGLPHQNPESNARQLPTEVIIQILLYLPLSDILNVSHTCHRLYRIVLSSSALAYHMELQICGITETTHRYPPPSPGLTIAQRMALLRTHRDRWNTLQFHSTSSHSLTEGCPLYELYAGVFAQVWPDPIFDQSIEPKICMRVLYLPSHFRGTEETTTLLHPDLRVANVAELTIDPDQDLLVLIEYAASVARVDTPAVSAGNQAYHINVLIRTLSTNEPHPGARMPALTWGSETRSILNARLVPMIIGDIFAFLQNPNDGASPSLITIWRWTTSEVLMMFYTPLPALSFTFLSEDTFVVPCTRQSPEMSIELQVYRLPGPGESIGPRNPVPLVTYHLPTLISENISGVSVECRCHPLPNPRPFVPQPRETAVPAEDSYSELEGIMAESDLINGMEGGEEVVEDDEPPDPTTIHPIPLLQSDRSERLVTFSFIFNVQHADALGHGSYSWQEAHVLVTHVSALLRHVPPRDPNVPHPHPHPHSLPLTPLSSTSTAPTPPTATPTGIHILWPEWSPHRTRWLVDRCRRNWISHTYGHRFVKPTWRAGDDHRDSFHVQVLDFNPWTVLREVALAGKRMWRGATTTLGSEDQNHSTGNESGSNDALEKAARTGDGSLPDTQCMTFDSPRDLVVPALNPLSPSKSLLPPSTCTLVAEPTTVSGMVFAEPVTTSLPYVEVTYGTTMYDFQGLMMCEEHVVNLAGEAQERSLEVFSI